MGEILYGTSSWSEKSWVGPFYPEGTAPAGFLPHYAAHFGTVEVDSTYYAIPSARTVRGWEAKTPGGFVLAAKFPRSIVHGGSEARPDAEAVLVPDRVGRETEAFLDVMRLMGGKCGPLLLQFPYFNREAFPEPGPFLDRLDAFLARLPRDFRYAVEVRNRAWVASPLLGTLRRHDVALVLVELGYLPHPADVAAKLDVVTADFAYARLIGDRKAVEERTKTFDRIVLERRPSLLRWAELLRELARRVPRAYVYANNHYAGHAPATIRELRGLVNG